jgi:ABC-type antimicrobial peptide transport system permease subunit
VTGGWTRDTAIAPTDPLTYGGAAMLLLLVALMAALIPARAAARVDPLFYWEHRQFRPFPQMSLVLRTVANPADVVPAAIGTYAVIAYATEQRAREIAFALGADRAAVLRMILGQGLVLIGISLLLGTLGGLALSRFLGALECMRCRASRCNCALRVPGMRFLTHVTAPRV